MDDLPATLTYFCSLQRTGQVLNRSALPLMEAHELNDPFLKDCQSEMPFNVEDMFENAVKHIAHLILGKSPPRGQPNHALQKAIMRWRMENRFSDESEIKEALQGLLPAMIEKSFNEAKECHQAWRKYVKSKKIAVLYEKFQEIEMWHSLGLSHKGVAIKFKCVEGSIFENCHPVGYSKQPAHTVSQKEYIENMVGSKPEVEFDPLAIILRQNYANRFMKEWRLITESNDSKEQWIEFPTELIQSVYLGALVPDKTAEQLKSHLAKLDPNINVYRASCKENEYSLDFEKISEEVEVETSENTDA